MRLFEKNGIFTFNIKLFKETYFVCIYETDRRSRNNAGSTVCNQYSLSTVPCTMICTSFGALWLWVRPWYNFNAVDQILISKRQFFEQQTGIVKPQCRTSKWHTPEPLTITYYYHTLILVITPFYFDPIII